MHLPQKLPLLVLVARVELLLEVARVALAALRDFAAVTVEPMQWVPPFQGDDYECAACPLRNATGPYEPWAPWM